MPLRPPHAPATVLRLRSAQEPSQLRLSNRPSTAAHPSPHNIYHAHQRPWLRRRRHVGEYRGTRLHWLDRDSRTVGPDEGHGHGRDQVERADGEVPRDAGEGKEEKSDVGEGRDGGWGGAGWRAGDEDVV